MLRLLIRHGVRKGLWGRSRPWLVVGGVAFAVRLVRKLAGSNEEVVYREQLRPGEAVVVANGRDAMMEG